MRHQVHHLTHCYSKFTFIDCPLDFLHKVEKVVGLTVKTPVNSPVMFHLSKEAAIHNMKILSSQNCDLNLLIENNPNSFISYGSEFRPVESLIVLLGNHPKWPRLEKLLKSGSRWPLEKDLDEKSRKEKNAEMINRGNHRSANTYCDELLKKISTEVAQGWMISIPIEFINSVSEIAPMGIVHQFQSHEDGTRSDKFRAIHNQSFGEDSVNSRIAKDKLDDLTYGDSLSRIIHIIISIRFRHPTTRILIGKSSISSNPYAR